jgi:hypothetical protein
MYRYLQRKDTNTGKYYIWIKEYSENSWHKGGSAVRNVNEIVSDVKKCFSYNVI